MEIQSIDLYGDFLLNGGTGSNGQVLTFDQSGGFVWGTASTSGSGPTSSYAKTEGYNYVICETVNTGNPANDAITNGNNLYNTYQFAKTINIGGLSATNRVSILLMPGDYDLGDSAQFELDTSYIDLVGISTNPYNTVLKSTQTSVTLRYSNPVDSILKNIYLKPGTIMSLDDNSGSGDGTFLRWENLVLDGNCFSDGSNYAFDNIYGEFKNIKILNSARAFIVQMGSIDGIFENIEVYDALTAISVSPLTATTSQVLNGTFSNITFYGGSSGFMSLGKLQGNHKNIRGSSTLYSSAYDIEGSYDNIETNAGGLFQISNGGGISGVYKNIKAHGGSSFLSSEYIDGVFQNIDLKYDTGDFFVANSGTSGTVSGTFSNITITGAVNSAFTSKNSLLGNYENIKITDVSTSVFVTQRDEYGPFIETISGNFKNIDIGNVYEYSFATKNYLTGHFDDIKLGNFVNVSHGAFITDDVLYLTQSYIDGIFNDISIGQDSSVGNGSKPFFFTGGTFSGTFSNINIIGGSNSIYFTSHWGSLYGNYTDIEFGDSTHNFYARKLINGTFDRIKSQSPSQTYAFTTQDVGIYGTFSNIYFAGTTSSFVSQEIRINLENFEQKESNDVLLVNGVQINGNFKNIYVQKCYGNFLFSNNGLYGQFNNIDVDGFYDGVNQKYFISAIGATRSSGTFTNISSTNFYRDFYGEFYYSLFKNIRLQPVDTCFGGQHELTEINDLIAWSDSQEGVKGGMVITLKDQSGPSRLINCKVTNSGTYGVWFVYLNNSYSNGHIVENCRFDTSSGYGSVYSSGAGMSNLQVIYNIFSEPYWDGGSPPFLPGDTLMVPNYNVVHP